MPPYEEQQPQMLQPAVGQRESLDYVPYYGRPSAAQGECFVWTLCPISIPVSLLIDENCRFELLQEQEGTGHTSDHHIALDTDLFDKWLQVCFNVLAHFSGITSFSRPPLCNRTYEPL